MSLYDYQQSQRVSDTGFYALIMAAMQNADHINLQKLSSQFPEVYEELKERYNAPGGLLPSDS